MKQEFTITVERVVTFRKDISVSVDQPSKEQAILAALQQTETLSDKEFVFQEKGDRVVSTRSLKRLSRTR